MLFSFSEMAFGDTAWFTFDFTKSLSLGDFIVGTPAVTVGAGLSLNPNTITIQGTGIVICRITAGNASIDTFVSCSITTNGGVISTRSGAVPVRALVPS